MKIFTEEFVSVKLKKNEKNLKNRKKFLFLENIFLNSIFLENRILKFYFFKKSKTQFFFFLRKYYKKNNFCIFFLRKLILSEK